MRESITFYMLWSNCKNFSVSIRIFDSFVLYLRSEVVQKQVVKSDVMLQQLFSISYSMASEADKF